MRVPWTVILKEISPEYSMERLMLKLERQSFGHLMRRKDPDARKDGRREEKGTTEDETVRSHHLLKGHEFEEALEDSGGPRSLMCCSHGVSKSRT